MKKFHPRNIFYTLIFFGLARIPWKIAKSIGEDIPQVEYLKWYLLAFFIVSLKIKIIRDKILLPTVGVLLSYQVLTYHEFIPEIKSITDLINRFLPYQLSENMTSLIMSLTIGLSLYLVIKGLYVFSKKVIEKVWYFLSGFLPGVKRKRIWNLAQVDLEKIDSLNHENRPDKKLKFRNKKLYNKKMGQYVKDKGYMFEDLTANLYRAMGYNTKTTTELRNERNLPINILQRGGPGEQGVDVVVEYTDKDKTKKIMIIQCKHYSSNIGNSAVQEIFTAKNLYEDHFKKPVSCAVLTNQFFTSSAKELAKINEVQLIDRHDLADMLYQVQGKLDQLAA